MLKWKQIADDFISIDVGKEYDSDPYYWTTFYYYKGLIVDSGCPHTAEEAANFIESKKLDIEAVLLTHYHEDHSGGAYLLKDRLGVNVFAPEKSLEILEKPPKVPTYREMVWGQPEPFKANSLPRKMEFKSLVVDTVDTPGHSFDHVSFLTKDILFMGDVITNPTPVIVMREDDYIDLMESLRTIINLDFKIAYGGHGVWNKEGVKAALDNASKLKEKIKELWTKGLKAEEIVEKVFSNAPSKVLLMEEMSEGEWSRKNLVESMLGMRHKPHQSTLT